jgi:WD40 repeat protein
MTSAVFTADGEWFAAGVNDNSVRLYDAADGRLLIALSVSQRTPTALAISPDSSRIAVAYSDKMIRIYDARNGEVRSTVPSGPAMIRSLHYLPDERLLGVFEDGSARAWPLDPLAAAGRTAPRELTDGERREYLPEDVP